MIYRYLFILTILTAILLGGCSSSEDSPTTASFVISTDKMLNLNISGQSTPVEIQLVYLKENSKMENLYYDELALDNLKKALGKTYIDHQDYVLKPNQLKPLAKVKLKEGTNYIGVIAHFANIDNANWYKVIPVKDVNKQYTILIGISGNEINLQKDEKS